MDKSATLKLGMTGNLKSMASSSGLKLSKENSSRNKTPLLRRSVMLGDKRKKKFNRLDKTLELSSRLSPLRIDP
jgi:hypothetical protein